MAQTTLSKTLALSSPNPLSSSNQLLQGLSMNQVDKPDNWQEINTVKLNVVESENIQVVIPTALEHMTTLHKLQMMKL